MFARKKLQAEDGGLQDSFGKSPENVCFVW